MHGNAGYTLTDLVVTLAVLAVLFASAVPALSKLLLDARMTRQVNGLVHGVHLARQTALVRLTEVALCKSPAGDDCRHEGRWEDGWLLFVNADRDYPPRVSRGDARLAAGGAWDGGRIDSNRRFYVFRPATIRSTNGTFVFCDRRGAAAARALIVSYTGRPRTARHGAGGRALLCQT
jgi:type IV fimbrial biogenesis protein FimT